MPNMGGRDIEVYGSAKCLIQEEETVRFMAVPSAKCRTKNWEDYECAKCRVQKEETVRFMAVPSAKNRVRDSHS